MTPATDTLQARARTVEGHEPPAWTRALGFGRYDLVGIVRFDTVEGVAVFHRCPEGMGHYHGRTITPPTWIPAMEEGRAA